MRRKDRELKGVRRSEQKEKMKREEMTVCEKAREEDERRKKQRTVLEIKPNGPPNDPGFMSCQTGPRPKEE